MYIYIYTHISHRLYNLSMIFPPTVSKVITKEIHWIHGTEVGLVDVTEDIIFCILELVEHEHMGKRDSDEHSI